jgi:hypothetical protein
MSLQTGGKKHSDILYTVHGKNMEIMLKAPRIMLKPLRIIAKTPGIMVKAQRVMVKSPRTYNGESTMYNA